MKLVGNNTKTVYMTKAQENSPVGLQRDGHPFSEYQRVPSSVLQLPWGKYQIGVFFLIAENYFKVKCYLLNKH